MHADYSLRNASNFDLFFGPRVGKLIEVFNLHVDTLDDDTAVNIVDFGTNDGRNIFPFLKIMIEQMRCRSTKRTINVFLNDQPSNDFNELAKNAEAFQRDMNDQFLHVYTKPGNAYGRCFPESSIDFGTCYLMLQWLSRPVKVENHLLYFPNQMVSDHEKSEITGLAAQDWKNFVQSRSMEMKKGAIISVDVLTDVKDIYEICSALFVEFFQRNVISKVELQNTTVPMYPYRSETDLKAPFEHISEEIGVKLLDLSKRKIRAYENKDLAARVRSWMFHSIMAGLCQTRNYNDANNICDLFFDELKLHFLDKKWIDVEIYDVIFQKL